MTPPTLWEKKAQRKGTCKRGQTQKQTDCTPASGGGSASVTGQSTDNTKTHPYRVKLTYQGPLTGPQKTKLRKQLLKEHGADPEFHELSNGLSFYTQGFFDHIRRVGAAVNTGTVEELEANAQGYFGMDVREGKKDPTMALAVMSTVKNFVYGESSDDENSDLTAITYRKAQRYAKLIQGGIEQSQPSEQPLYRGLTVQERNLPDVKPGDEFDIAEPTSWTRSAELGEKFARGTVKGQTSKKSGVPFVISVVGPNKALDIDVFSPWHQQEALSDGRFEVVSYDKSIRPVQLVLKQTATVGIPKTAVKYQLPKEIAVGLTQEEYDFTVKAVYEAQLFDERKVDRYDLKPRGHMMTKYDPKKVEAALRRMGLEVTGSYD